MNPIQFAPLHNMHIRFEINGKILSGIVADDHRHKTAISKNTDYTFVHSRDLRRWKDAEQRNDRKMMKELSFVVNIEDIKWGELI